MSLFGLPFLLVGLFLTYLYFDGYVQWLRAMSWVEVPCWVETVGLRESRSDDSTTYQTQATYRYVYKDKVYHADRVSFYSGSDNIGEFQQVAFRELREYAAVEIDAKGRRKELKVVGGEQKAFRCFVNPADPTQAVLYRDFRWPMQAFYVIFALTFPAIGAPLVFNRWFGRNDAASKLLEEEFPAEPWKWRSDWAQGVVRSVRSPWSLGAFVYASWSAMIVGPLIMALAYTGTLWTDAWSWLCLVFVVVWAVPAYFTFRELNKRRVARQPELRLVEPFVSPGGTWNGEITVASPLPPGIHPEFELVCEEVRRISTSDGISTSIEKVWQGLNAASEATDHFAFTTNYRVSFELPVDLHESSIADDEVTYRYRVEMKDAAYGVLAGFEVPVFHSEQSRNLAEVAKPNLQAVHEADVDSRLRELLATDRLVVEFDEIDRIRSIDVPSRRFLSAVISLIVFEIVWLAVSCFLLLTDAPLLFKIVWPTSCVVIAGTIVWLMFYRQIVIFTSQEVVIDRDLLGFHWSKHIMWTDTGRFNFGPSSQVNNQQYYRVYLETIQGHKHTIASGIRSQETAAALSRRLQWWLEVQ